MNNSQLAILQDSLKLQLLDIAIAKAGLEVTQTNIWHRLLPEIRVSASLGVQQLVFIDPTTFTPYTLPKDSYRLTASLSISDVFDETKHEHAALDVQRLQTEKDILQCDLKAKRTQRLQDIQSMQQQLLTLNEELALVQRILQYKQLLFDQGKADFDELVKAKLQVLNVKQSINTLLAKLNSYGQQ